MLISSVAAAQPLALSDQPGNDSVSSAEFLNSFGSGDGEYSDANLSQGPGDTGGAFFAVELERGDFLSLTGFASFLNGGSPRLSLEVYGPEQTRLVRSSGTHVGFNPPASPLLRLPGAPPTPSFLNDFVELHFLANRSGLYTVGVKGRNGGVYDFSMRVSRAPLEDADLGVRQIVFLDFDGAVLVESIFGLPSGTSLSPLSDFLTPLGLAPADEASLIELVVEKVDRLLVSAIRRRSSNPAFDLELRSSLTDVDPWGQPNVSRVIIGGTCAELFGGACTVAFNFAESVDPGNFDTTETALIGLGPLAAPSGDYSIPALSIASGAELSNLEVVAEALAVVVTHEIGHYLGNYHTTGPSVFSNQLGSIMDAAPSSLATFLGAGNDGALGNGDDRPLEFGSADLQGDVDGDYDTFDLVAFGSTRRDVDRDQVADEEDNCLGLPNGPDDLSNQVDSDLDGIGNACDGDLNNDGVVTTADATTFIACFVDAESSPADDPGCFESDMNGDGLRTTADYSVLVAQLTGSAPIGPSGLGCASPIGTGSPCFVPDVRIDTDGDGVENPSDNCLIHRNGSGDGSNQIDADGDGFGNACDGDFNNSGFVSTFDASVYYACAATPAGSPPDDPNCLESDLDGDGLVTSTDLDIFIELYPSPPGPSGVECGEGGVPQGGGCAE